MNTNLVDLLRRVDTPTVCNAIEVVEGRRGFAGFTRGTMLWSAPSGAPMVGYARTAKIAGAKPPSEAPKAVRARRLDYYRMMAGGARPAVAVVEDTDHPGCVGAFWGEVNTTIHKALGLSGALTNGVMRDLGDLPADFPVLAGSIGPSHAFVHVTAIDVPVEIFGLRIAPGDLIHADRHGALSIPPAVLSKLVAAIETLRAAERLILDPARRPGFDLAAFEEAWAAFERART